MTSNLFSFCSHYTVDNMVMYLWVLSLLMATWTFTSLMVNLFVSPPMSVRALSRVNFDKVEYMLMGTSSLLMLFLVVLNLLVMRSHVPSSSSMYSFERNASDSISIVGRQWYWVYSLFKSSDDFEIDSKDSYICNLVNCVDNSIKLQKGVSYSLNMTSADVLHSFALPSAQLKMDAIPGRINSVYLLAKVPGMHTGYCSEFCGAGHSYMPMVVKVF